MQLSSATSDGVAFVRSQTLEANPQKPEGTATPSRKRAKFISQLHNASEAGNDDQVKKLLEDNLDIVNECDAAEWTALHFASDAGHDSTVSILLDKGADISAQDENGWTPLHWAIDHGHISTVKLLQDRGADITTPDKNLYTALHYACMGPHISIVALLLDGGAVVNAKDKRGMTPLHWAARSDHSSIVTLLVDRGARVNEPMQGGGTALHFASMGGHVATMRALIERGADLDAHDQHGKTALQFASDGGHSHAMELLLDRGSSLRVTNEINETPLHLACKAGNLAAVKLLVSRGADVHAVDKRGSTPLHLASEAGSLSVVTVLLDSGSRLEAPNQAGLTPLHKAASHGNDSVILGLLARGANIDCHNQDGNTPLHLACAEGRSSVSLLLDKGAKLHSVNDEGNTPLHVACARGRNSIVALLLRRGADFEKTNEEGNTPLDLALAADHSSIVDILQRAALQALNFDDALDSVSAERVAVLEDQVAKLKFNLSEKETEIESLMRELQGFRMHSTGGSATSANDVDSPEKRNSMGSSTTGTVAQELVYGEYLILLETLHLLTHMKEEHESTHTDRTSSPNRAPSVNGTPKKATRPSAMKSHNGGSLTDFGVDFLSRGSTDVQQDVSRIVHHTRSQIQQIRQKYLQKDAGKSSKRKNEANNLNPSQLTSGMINGLVLITLEPSEKRIHEGAAFLSVDSLAMSLIFHGHDKGGSTSLEYFSVTPDMTIIFDKDEAKNFKVVLTKASRAFGSETAEFKVFSQVDGERFICSVEDIMKFQTDLRSIYFSSVNGNEHNEKPDLPDGTKVAGQGRAGPEEDDHSLASLNSVESIIETENEKLKARLSSYEDRVSRIRKRIMTATNLYEDLMRLHS